MAETSISDQSSFASDRDGAISDLDDDQQSVTFSPAKSSSQRPSRQRMVPAKFREAEFGLRTLEEVQLDMTSELQVLMCYKNINIGRYIHVYLYLLWTT